ncbi:MAG: uL13 family ribosomal protein [Patescibacteria group bacterium]
MTNTTTQENNNSKTAPKMAEKAVRSKIGAGKEYTLDAKGKKLGRVASEAAKILLGKDKSDFMKNTVALVKVKVVNASGLLITEKKKCEKTYARYSGYPGGLRHESLEDIIEKKGCKAALWEAVYGMLPGNKLRTPRLKNLIISE